MVQSETLISTANTFTFTYSHNSHTNRFKKCDRIKDAVDVCVFLNQWDTAKALADQFEFKGVDTLFTKYASHLLEKGKITIAIDAYREAGQYLDAAKLLYGLAEDAAKTKLNPLRAKKLYVLAALQVEAYRDAKKAKNADPTRSAIDGMLAEDSTSQSQLVKNRVCSLSALLLLPRLTFRSSHFMVVSSTVLICPRPAGPLALLFVQQRLQRSCHGTFSG